MCVVQVMCGRSSYMWSFTHHARKVCESESMLQHIVGGRGGRGSARLGGEAGQQLVRDEGMGRLGLGGHLIRG